MFTFRDFIVICNMPCNRSQMGASTLCPDGYAYCPLGTLYSNQCVPQGQDCNSQLQCPSYGHYLYPCATKYMINGRCTTVNYCTSSGPDYVCSPDQCSQDSQIDNRCPRNYTYCTSGGLAGQCVPPGHSCNTPFECYFYGEPCQYTYRGTPVNYCTMPGTCSYVK